MVYRFKTSTSITVAVSGTFVDEGQGSTTILPYICLINRRFEKPGRFKPVSESLIKKMSQVLTFPIIEKEFILMAKLNSIS